MEKHLLRKIVANTGQSLGLLEITDSTLVGLKVKYLGSSSDNEDHYLMVLADKIVSGWDDRGMEVRFHPNGRDAENYTFETRAKIMRVLPVRYSFGKPQPEYKLLEGGKCRYLVERAGSGFSEIIELFKDAGSGYELYAKLLTDRLVSWKETNISGTIQDPELRFGP